MDLLYSRYASPMELMNIYINQGRFGEFVTEILEMDSKRKQEAKEKEEDNKLWIAYVHSMSEVSFNDWKAKLMQGNNSPKGGKDENMTEADMEAIINNLFPEG